MELTLNIYWGLLVEFKGVNGPSPEALWVVYCQVGSGCTTGWVVGMKPGRWLVEAGWVVGPDHTHFGGIRVGG